MFYSLKSTVFRHVWYLKGNWECGHGIHDIRHNGLETRCVLVTGRSSGGGGRGVVVLVLCSNNGIGSLIRDVSTRSKDNNDQGVSC